jgi:hypothetical protein
MIITKEIFETIVAGMTFEGNAINFKFGYWTTVANELLTDGKSPSLAAQRFPLIYLHADFEENIINYRTIRINPTFYIIQQTEVKYNIDQRLELIYKPCLYQIYIDFIKAIRHSGKINPSNSQEILHTKKDLYYLQNISSAQNNLKSIIDAVEVRFSQLDLYKSPCYYDAV